MPIQLTIRATEFDLRFELNPPVSGWELASEEDDGLHTTYRGGGYSLAFREERQASYSLLEFTLERDNGEPFGLHRYLLTAESDAVNLDRVWEPWRLDTWVEPVGLQRNDKNAAEVTWGHAEAYRTSADRGMPLFMGLDRSGNTTLAIALLDHRIETEIRHDILTHYAAGNQDRGTMRIRLQRPMDGYSIGTVAKYHDGIFVSSGASWFDTVQTLRTVHDDKTGRTPRLSPNLSWEPLLAPFGGATKGNWRRMRPEELGPDEMWQMAKVASELGFRGFMDGTGWFMDPQQAFKGEYTWGFPDYTGDLVPSPKFPDLKGFVARLKSIHMMWLLWISPWVAGRRTKTRERLREALVNVDMDHSNPRYHMYTSYLCPRNPITQRYVPGLLAGLVKEYGVEGFVVDMIESSPVEACIADHEHNYSSVGLAMANSFVAIREALDAVNPDTLIEFRARYSNISNLYNATQHRSIDSGEAGSYDMNRRNCVILRSYVPPGVAVHNDPVWWHIYEKNETVAKMLSTAVVSGVPQVLADVINMTDDHRRLVKVWLAFYQEHKEDFRWGRLRPVQHDARFSTVKVERDGKAFVSYASYPALKVPLSPEANEIYLFNCTNENSLYTILMNVEGRFRASVHDYDLSRLAETKLNTEQGHLLVEEEVPQGGVIVLRRM